MAEETARDTVVRVTADVDAAERKCLLAARQLSRAMRSRSSLVLASQGAAQEAALAEQLASRNAFAGPGASGTVVPHPDLQNVHCQVREG